MVAWGEKRGNRPAGFAQAGGQRAKGVKQRLTKPKGRDAPGLQQEVGGATGNRTGSPLSLPDRGQLARKIEEGGGGLLGRGCQAPPQREKYHLAYPPNHRLAGRDRA